MNNPMLIFWSAIAMLICVTGCSLPSAASKVKGKTFVITGASSGFGRGTAVKLGSQGANVVIAARRTELLMEVAAEIQAAGGQALVVTTDVTDTAQMQHLAKAAVTRFGSVDV
ncbi:MAG: family NAD(P)-dependent oxidoreductase, partial [Prosthecobacter sp.]|nr:family NAD(P)-dependent oxidoreductase [Prosthecobacter sp.]